jgi:TetR/AcrR family transcriptional regulator, transcriptional repressor for nem operon
MDPPHAHPVAHPVPRRARAQPIDMADHLVPRHDRQLRRRRPALNLVELRVANPASRHPDPHFARSRLRLRQFYQLKRRVALGERDYLFEDHCTHGDSPGLSRSREEESGIIAVCSGTTPLDTIPTGRYVVGMPKIVGESAREKLLTAGTDLFRRQGFVATSVDEICTEAGVTKGAFFHHFQTKEALAEACLAAWDERFKAMFAAAPFQAIDQPLEKLLAALEFFAGLFDDPNMLKSCLAGTTVQEVAETHPVLREAAQNCFLSGERHFQALLNDACCARGLKLDTASLARLWMATMQGSFLLCKASGDPSIVSTNLRHFTHYIESLFADVSRAATQAGPAGRSPPAIGKN